MNDLQANEAIEPCEVCNRLRVPPPPKETFASFVDRRKRGVRCLLCNYTLIPEEALVVKEMI